MTVQDDSQVAAMLGRYQAAGGTETIPNDRVMEKFKQIMAAEEVWRQQPNVQWAIQQAKAAVIQEMIRAGELPKDF